MKRMVLIAGLIVLLVCFSSAVTMPNPAAQKCRDDGGKYVIVDTPAGQQGWCYFRCEEWAYYRGECPPRRTTTTMSMDLERSRR